MDEKTAGLAENYFKAGGDSYFLESLREADRVGCRKHIKVKAQAPVSFRWFLFDSGKTLAEWWNGGLRALMPESTRVHQRTSLSTLRYCFRPFYFNNIKCGYSNISGVQVILILTEL